MAQGSYSDDGTLLSVVGQGVAVDGDWFECLRSPSATWARSTLTYAVSMTVGTGTWVLEGRNGPNDSPIQLDTGTASKTAVVPFTAQMRLRWTAASGLTARGTVSTALKNTTYTPFFVQQSAWYNGLIGGYWPSGDGVTDSFNRADNALTLGNADTGQPWVALVGTWGISSNQARLVTGGSSNNSAAVVDSGKSDCTISLTPTVRGTAATRIVFRATDANNGFIVDISSGNGVTIYRQQGVVGGLYTSIAANGTAPVANGDVFSVVLAGSSITLKQNGVVLLTATDAFNVTATKHGIGADDANTTARLDSFSVV